MHSADRAPDPDTLAILRELEESLWRAETRYDNAWMGRIFADDFFEFGRSGKVYARREMFVEESAPDRIDATLLDFHARHLSDDVVQVTYLSELTRKGVLERANRSSIWTSTPDGWKLRFHQGTPV